LLLVATLTKQG